jgi:uncharacterized protein YecT (DUF1311 family)
MKSLHLVLLLGFHLSTHAQGIKPGDWEPMCKDITARPLIEPRITAPLTVAQLPGCNSEALYYGFGTKPDYAAALQCAWYERAHPNTTIADMNRGVGVLTMLYANGRGVAKDVDLAMRFACEQPWAAPLEMVERIQHLIDIKDGKRQTTPFDMCDDITSGLSMGKCTRVHFEFADAERNKKLSDVTANLTRGQRPLYDRLHTAEAAFEDIRINNEIDLFGTARAAFMLEDLGRLREQFIINLQRFSKGDVPPATAMDVTNLDAQMNALYQRIMQAPAASFAGTVNANTIRDTQRVWLKLRDAWLEFAKSAYPELSADRVVAQLLRLRLDQLRQLPIDVR